MAEQISFGTRIDSRGGPHVQVRVWAGKRLTDRALCGSLTMLPDEAEELCKRLSDAPLPTSRWLRARSAAVGSMADGEQEIPE